MNDMNEYREIGFVKVKKGSCYVNYTVNLVICGEERCALIHEKGFKIVDHSMPDFEVYELLGDAKKVITSNDEMVEVKISEQISARIYKV